jgi:hypothetical protein
MMKEPTRAKEAFDKDFSTVGNEVGFCDAPEKALQRNFISVPIADGTLGTYENWRTVLAEQVGLDNPDVNYLAHMCAKLVDAPKQGLRLKGTFRDEDKMKFQEIPRPLWFMDKRVQQRKNGLRPYHDLTDIDTQGVESTTTMDFLYDTLLKETAAFTKYSRSMFYDPDAVFKDPELTEPWTRALELASQLNDDALKADLEHIKSHIVKNHHDYQNHLLRFSQRSRNPRRHQNRTDIEDDFPQFDSHFELEEYFAKDFLENPSVNEIKSGVLLFDIHANGGQMFLSMKASYAYILSVTDSKYNKYCYVVAYDALRRIKADAIAKKTKENGLAEPVSIGTYKCMTLDRRWIRKLKELNYVSGDHIDKAMKSDKH